SLMGKRIEDISPERQPDGKLSLDKGFEVRAAALQGSHHRFEWLHRRRNGEEFTVDVTLTGVELFGRQGLLAVWHDLTERKRVEAALRESEERFQTFMNNSPTVAFIKDEEGRYVYVNRVMQEKFQLRPEEIIGRTDLDWMPLEAARVVMDA